ncbi:MAG TPA: glycosyl hydrolase family 28-related protein [Candidatus Hydrogenedentes bacterium]|nr:glycosyl hydrolase family 28-related protein [Candidatus Hydrogenedentota bacterium]
MYRKVCSACIVVLTCMGGIFAENALDTAVIDITKPPYNAIGDGITDNTGAFQDALHRAGEGPAGGKVFVPRGNYLIKGNLRFRPNVTLEGVWDFPPHSPQCWEAVDSKAPLPGSVLLAVEGEGDPEGTPFITLHTNCAVKGMVIYYPNQTKTNPPKSYPWTVAVNESGADHCTILEVLMVNPYQAVNFGRAGSGRHFIRDLYAYPLYRGLFVDQCYDIGRVENIHFWPFWGYTGDDDPVGRFVTENAEAFIIGRTDWEYMVNCFAIFYKVGFHFIKTAAGSPNVLLTQSGSDICPDAVLVDDCQSHAGVSFVNSQLFGRIRVSETNTGPVRFTGCGFFGATREKAPKEPIHFEIAGTGHVSLDNCHLITLSPQKDINTCILARGGGLSVMNCLFMDAGRTYFQLEPGLRTGIICGNTFRGVSRIVNNAKGNVQIGLNADERMPEEPGAIVIDNTAPDGSFSTEGTWFLGKSGSDYMGVVSWAEKGDGSSKAWWRPDFPESGRYEVFIWHGDDPNNDHAIDAPIVIRHKGGNTERRLNLREKAGQWRSLGFFDFDQGRSGDIMMHNGANGNVLADAMKFCIQK